MKKNLLNYFPFSKKGIKRHLLTINIALIIAFLNLFVQKLIRYKSLVYPFVSDSPLRAGLIRTSIILIALFFTISFNNAIYASEFQPVAVSGTITDLQGAPLIGVTVAVKGSAIGTLTDVTGKYTLSNVPQNATLVFSFVGMKTQEILLEGRTQINVVLTEEAIGLEEVVVVGYGTQKKVNLTGAVAAVSGTVLKDRPLTNMGQGLQGVVPNLQHPRVDLINHN